MSKEAIRLALEKIADALPAYIDGVAAREYLTVIHKALAEQPAQQEHDAIGCKCSECGAWQRWSPSGMVCKNGHGGVSGVNHRLYTSPPAQRTWVGLTDEDIFSVLGNLQAIYNRPPTEDSRVVFALAIEAKLKEKNT